MSNQYVRSEFSNELGKKIKIVISPESDEKIGCDLVNIKMEGPDSTCENIVTVKEARRLQEALNKFFGQADQE